ncbi:MAG: FAD binding domain-containing protein [Anaerolineae bacterium]|jgi:carbon-monoxide dehydrogenase medium subunit|nr:FAD binding domain-containing protein [Anaerolineae bacterium]MDH7474952.1 FAD binding domain-containing protein [Anaerolineae bacterium]
MWQNYLLPASVEEALEMLADYNGRARLVAGGTDLILELREGKRQIETLVDVTRIPGLDAIVLDSGMITLGAAVTYRQVIDSPLLQAKAAVLVEASRKVGSPQIRNVGTLVGNVVNAMPAADGAIALFALGAELEIASPAGRRRVPIEALYEGPGQSKVDPSREMVTAIRFPALGENQGSAFERLARRKALALPVLNVAVVVMLDRDAFADARLAIGPVAPTPFRARQAEETLRGAPANPEMIQQAAEMAASEARPRSSLLRASAAYRQETLKVLVRRALTRAVTKVAVGRA